MSYYSGPKTVTDGLVMYLDAANPKSYPGSGTSWRDLSGNGNDGTISSGEFVSSGPGSYLRNSGNTSNFFIVTVPHSTTLNNTLTTTTGGWTIEEIIWTNSVTYPEADGGSVASDAAYGSGATGFDWNHGITNTSFKFGQSSNSGGGYEDNVTITVNSPYDSLNTWRVRTMVWNRGSNTNYLYINGVLIGTAATPNTANTSIYDGGGIIFGSLYGWKHFGRRASIKIYNRALPESEILQNFGSIKSKFSL
jgi:hypothetical protein